MTSRRDVYAPIIARVIAEHRGGQVKHEPAPNPTGGYGKRITFLIAWWIDTKAL